MVHKRNGKPVGEIVPTPVVSTAPRANGKPLAEAKPQADISSAEVTWNEDSHAAENYAAIGKQLAASGDIYRNAIYGNGLLMVLHGGRHVSIAKGPDLLPIIVDRLRVRRDEGRKKQGALLGFRWAGVACPGRRSGSRLRF